MGKIATQKSQSDRKNALVNLNGKWCTNGVNGKPLPILNKYKLNTEMNGVQRTTIWWEAETNTKPIFGKDNFDKLGLQLTERSTKPGYKKRHSSSN